jgi:hypothetical protein
MKKLSIGFLPNIKRKNLKSGKTQIVMRVIADGLKKEVRLPEVYDLSDSDLQKWNYSSQRLDSKNSDVNDYLSAIYSRRKLLDLENLKDSKGYNIDLGYRGKVSSYLQFDVSFFYLQYNNYIYLIL